MDKIRLRSELPEKEPHIYGREKEIDDIVQALLEKSCKTVAGFLVTGTAGVGKSTVAIQAGYRLKDEFGAIVKYCSLRGAYKGSREVESVVREILNVCVPGNYQGTEYPKHVLLNWCRQLDSEMILIIDNVEDVVEGRDKDWFLNLLSDMRMRSDCKIKFLITSSLDVETVGTASNILLRKLGLGPLDVAESIEILKDSANLTSNTDTETKAKLHQIAEICENIPLALRLAGPLLAMESEYTFDGLKCKLEQNPARTLGVKPIMEIAFEKLDESLQRALVSLSVFPQSFKRDAAEAILGADDCAEALTNLKKRCLIQKQDDRYLIHLLIRGYAKQIGQRKEFRQILVDGKQGYLKHVLTLILRNAQKYWGKDTCKESFQLFNEERINIEYILQEVVGGQKKVQNCKELEEVVDACGLVAPYIEDCVPFKLYDDFLNGLLQFSLIQGNKTKQVEILFLLYDESRRHGGDMKKSKDLIDQAVKLYNSNLHLFEQSKLSKAFFLSHYGRYLSQDNDRRDEAQPLLNQALSIGKKEVDEHASIFDIGRVLSQMGLNVRLGNKKNVKRTKEASEKRLKDALSYFQEALHFRQSQYGEHVVTALSLKDLAGHNLSMGDLSKAEENYEAAVQTFEGMGMMKQKEAIPTYKNFGICYEKSGRIDQARRKFEMGSEVAENTIEGNHKWKVEINTNLALLLYRNYPDEVRKAKELAKNVFSMAKELKMEDWCHSNELKAFFRKG